MASGLNRYALHRKYRSSGLPMSFPVLPASKGPQHSYSDGFPFRDQGYEPIYLLSDLVTIFYICFHSKIRADRGGNLQSASVRSPARSISLPSMLCLAICTVAVASNICAPFATDRPTIAVR